MVFAGAARCIELDQPASSAAPPPYPGRVKTMRSPACPARCR